MGKCSCIARPMPWQKKEEEEEEEKKKKFDKLWYFKA